METKMKDFVAAFSNQLEEALEIAEKFQPDAIPDVDNVVICGLGGSGIGGTIMSQLTSDEFKLPVTSVKDYDLPAFVNNRTLVIACSYSGNTEETLESVEEAAKRGASITVVSSGGKLSELAKQNNWPLVTIPGGYPPRGAFAFPIVQLFSIASKYKLIASDWRSEVEASIGYLNANSERISAEAMKLAEGTENMIHAVYAGSWLDGVAVRWRQQINENSKKLAWSNAYPEMTHNELVGWRDKQENVAIIFLKSPLDHPRTLKRMELTEEVYRKYTSHIYECHAQGESRLQDALYLIHLGDWFSVHLAEIRGMDDMEVEVIDWMKGELAKV